jgi:hypothetical protein
MGAAIISANRSHGASFNHFLPHRHETASKRFPDWAATLFLGNSAEQRYFSPSQGSGVAPCRYTIHRVPLVSPVPTLCLGRVLLFNGESWINSGQWLSNTTECFWYMEWENPDFCGAGWRVTYLSFSTNNLSGTLPTELELLSDLENIQIGLLPDYNKLSGEIYTEL